MNRLGIQSLNAGAPDLRLSGDQTQRGTYVQRRRAQMAGGGIMGSNAGSMLVAPTADGSRPGYGWLDKIADLIPNELKDPVTTAYDKLIPNELKNPVVAATLANYAPVMMGGDDTLIQKGIGAITGTTPENNALDYLKNIITGSPNVVNEELERVIGDPTQQGDYDIYGNKIPETGGSTGIIGAATNWVKDQFGNLVNQVTGQKVSADGTGQGINWQLPMAIGAGAGLAQQKYLEDQPPFPGDETGIKFQTAQEAMADPKLRFKPQAQYANVAEGGRIGYAGGGSGSADYYADLYSKYAQEMIQAGNTPMPIEDFVAIMKEQGHAQGGRIGAQEGGLMATMDEISLEFQQEYGYDMMLAEPELREWYINKWKEKNFYDKSEAPGRDRVMAQEGGLMNLGGMEKDYREEGGFVPIGGEEKADDVPARLSKNEFVFTADAVRNAGGGDIDAGAQVMENLMEHLEAGGKVSEDSQGLEGAQAMFANTQKLQNRII